jgi:hypothetical protein
VGIALAKRLNVPLPESWGVAHSVGEAALKPNVARAAINQAEAGIEAQVSEYIGRMPFLWLDLSDAPGPRSNRGLIERNAIALLSGGYSRPAAGQALDGWLGHYSDRERVRLSGLWNNNHTHETYNPSFLDEMEHRVNST